MVILVDTMMRMMMIIVILIHLPPSLRPLLHTKAETTVGNFLLDYCYFDIAVALVLVLALVLALVRNFNCHSFLHFFTHTRTPTHSRFVSIVCIYPHYCDGSKCRKVEFSCGQLRDRVELPHLESVTLLELFL